MALNQNVFARFDPSIAGAGPFTINSQLLDAIATGTAPFEGLWIPTGAAKNLSVDVFGTNSPTFSIQLYGTNVVAPMNSITITVGAAVAVNDVNTLTFISPNAGTIAASFTATATTTTNVAAGLAAAVNASTALQALDVVATSTAAVVTLTWPSLAPSGAAANYSSPISVGPQNTFTVVGSTTGAETFTLALGTTGNTIGSAIAAVSLTAITTIPRWIKARLASLSGVGATISAQLHGAG